MTHGNEIKKPELQQRVELALKVIKQAGQIIVEHFHRNDNVSFRKELSDNISTSADLAAEKAIVEAVQKSFPQDGIITEETGRLETAGDYLWVVDPLDGTSNFAMKIAYFGLCLSIQRMGETNFSCIFNPLIGDFAHAVLGEGAYFNHLPIKIEDESKTNRLVGFYIQGYGIEKMQEVEIQKALSLASKRVLNTWAPSLDWMALLRGYADYIVAYHTETEDFVPGAFIYQQAGGRVETWDQEPIAPNLLHDRRVTAIAAPPGNIEQIREIIARIKIAD